MKSLVDPAIARAWCDAGWVSERADRWSWFQPAFSTYVHSVWAHRGCTGRVDEGRLACAFFDWAQILDQTARYADQQPLDHAHYVCGRLLRCLLVAAPVKVTAAVDEGLTTPDRWQEWPEGHVLLGFVCNLLEAFRLRLDVGSITWQETLLESHWRSFRENVGEDAELAGPFLDLFLGLQPVWQFPAMTHLRPAARPSAS